MIPYLEAWFLAWYFCGVFYGYVLPILDVILFVCVLCFEEGIWEYLHSALCGIFESRYSRMDQVKFVEDSL